MAKITPLMRQYLKLKAKYKDAVLLFQMGDFYECFYEDAHIVSKELNIVLTSREKGEDAPPMAGFPVKALDSYLPKLVSKGYRVAIANQVEDPRLAKGLVRREVVEVVTSGTLTMPEKLEESDSKLIVSFYKDKDWLSFAYVDILQGEVKFAVLPSEAESIALESIKNLRPAEIVVDLNAKESINLQGYPVQFVELKEPARVISEFAGTSDLAQFDLDTKAAIYAVALLLSYIKDTKYTTPAHINKIVRWDPREYMFLDQTTIENLELFSSIKGERKHSLIGVIDNTKTGPGSRLLRFWLAHPLLDEKKIKERLNDVESFVQDPDLLEKIRDILGGLYDIERLTGVLGFKKASPKHLVMLKHSVEKGLKIVKMLQEVLPFKGDIEGLRSFIEKIDAALIDPPGTFEAGGVIKSSYSPEVKKLRTLTQDTQSVLESLLEELKSSTGITNLKVGYNKVFGYYIEVPKGQLSKVPSTFIRKQTLVNAERFITPELKELEQKIISAKEELYMLELRLYSELVEHLLEFVPELKMVSEYLAYVDVISTFAYNAIKFRYVRPEFLEKDHKVELELEGSRHPVVEQFVDEFVSNSLTVSKDQKFVLLTGPNMGGKSTFIRQVALISLLAQIGSFVPADKARVKVRDRIFARVGASDDISTGRSTFMVEMSEVARILKSATERSLVILDEVGRGTNTAEGLAIAYGVSLYLRKYINPLVIFATHFHELTLLEEVEPGFINYKVDVLEQGEDVFFLHTISRGSADKSYALYVAKLVNLPDEIIKIAQDKLAELSKQKLVLQSPSAPTLKIEEPKVTQMRLFDPLDSKVLRVLKKVKKLDINKITPLQALEILDNIKRVL